MMSRWIALMCAGISLVGSPLSAKNAEQAFNDVYENAAWSFRGEGPGFSGDGSSVINAAQYMEFLQNFVTTNGIRSVVDVGCGDWTFSQHLNWSGVNYTGIDVVGWLIEQNQQRYGRGNIKFLQGDGSSMDLPSGELLVCKDVLQHLPNEDILKFLKQTKKFKHCLITNDVDRFSLTSDNPNIAPGEYHNIDLSKAPFNVKGVKILTFKSGWVVKQMFYIKN